MVLSYEHSEWCKRFRNLNERRQKEHEGMMNIQNSAFIPTMFDF